MSEHEHTEQCTEALKWSNDRLGLWEVEYEGTKVSIFFNKDGTYGYAYLKDGICCADYHKVNLV